MDRCGSCRDKESLIFAFRATHPKVMKKNTNPIGPTNDNWLKSLHKGAGITIAAWGIHETYQGRGRVVLDSLDKVHCLGQTKEGHPRHPLYLHRDVKPYILKEDTPNG